MKPRGKLLLPSKKKKRIIQMTKSPKKKRRSKNPKRNKIIFIFTLSNVAKTFVFPL